MKMKEKTMATTIDIDSVQVGDRLLVVSGEDGFVKTVTGLVSEKAMPLDMWDFVLDDAEEVYVDEENDVVVLLSDRDDPKTEHEWAPTRYAPGTLVNGQRKEDEGRCTPDRYVVNANGLFVSAEAGVIYPQAEINVVAVLWEPSLKLA